MIKWIWFFLAIGVISFVIEVVITNYRDARTVVLWLPPKGRHKVREVMALVCKYSNEEELMTKGVQRYIIASVFVVLFTALAVISLCVAFVILILIISGGAI